MPLIKEKIVIINSKTRQVILCLKEALNVAGITEDSFVEKTAKTSVLMSLVTFVLPDGIKGSVTELVDAKEYILKEIPAIHDSAADDLRKAYEDLWTNLLKLDDIIADEIIDRNIKSSRVLIAEILTRFCTAAVSTNNNGDHDGDKILNAMCVFIAKICDKEDLIKKGLITKKMTMTMRGLNSEHDKWMMWIQIMVTAVKELHANKTAVQRAKNYLLDIETTLSQHLFAELITEKHASRKINKSSFNERMIRVKLRNIENECIDETLKRPLLSSHQAAMLSVRASTDKVLSIIDPDVNESALADTDLRRYPEDPQERAIHIVNSIKPKSTSLLTLANKKSRVENLYQLKRAGAILLEIISELENLNNTIGWIAIIFNLIDLSKISKLIETYTKNYLALTAHTIDAPFYKNYEAIGEGILMFKPNSSYLLRNEGMAVANGLRELQTPLFVKSILSRIHSSFVHLIGLENRLPNEFKELPAEYYFVNKFVRDRVGIVPGANGIKKDEPKDSPAEDSPPLPSAGYPGFFKRVIPVSMPAIEEQRAAELNRRMVSFAEGLKNI